MYKILFAPILSLVLLGCAGSPAQTGWEATRNRDAMLKLNAGQSKDQVLSLMGKPYKTEMYTVNGKPLEFWLYITERASMTGTSLQDSNFTPLAFENGILKGWGRNFYDNTVRIKKDITIEKK
jgi:outer membrane protein assembly factor BamE (lipoprotein component of BamABCDE complex)